MPSRHRRLDKKPNKTRWLVLQKARRHPQKRTPTLCGQNGFRFYFTGISSLLFTFPSRYLFAIGEINVFSLSRLVRLDSLKVILSSRYLSKTARSTKWFSNTGLLPSMAFLSRKILLTRTLPKFSPLKKYSSAPGILPKPSSCNLQFPPEGGN